MLQSYAYGLGQSRIGVQQRPRYGLIEIDGRKAGVLQILEAGALKNTLHAVILDRGPLWLDGFGEKRHWEAFLSAFSREFPARLGRKRRFIPEIDANSFILDLLHAYGWRQKSGSGYQTLWLDLTQSEDVLRKDLKKNWRNVLTKAEKSGLELVFDDTGRDLPWLLQHYTADRAAKGYDGPSVSLLKAMAAHALPRKEMLTAMACLRGKPVAGVLIFCHGGSATYQIGFTDDQGRSTGAHHMLLWHAVLALKARGIKDFDLGGLNDDTAKGVAAFKHGMGGDLLALPGIFG
ncbi:MAG: lipid II:glycine glycyltransferase FemX [Bdellovibrionales bacterium]